MELAKLKAIKIVFCTMFISSMAGLAASDDTPYGVIQYSIGNGEFVADLQSACDETIQVVMGTNWEVTSVVEVYDLPSSTQGICNVGSKDKGPDGNPLYTHAYSVAATLACHCDEEKLDWQCVPKEPNTQMNFSTSTVTTHVFSAEAGDADRCQIPLPPEFEEDACTYNENTPLTNFPINCATGQKEFTETDYQGAGLDALRYSRYYKTNPDGLLDNNGSSLISNWESREIPTMTKIDFDDGAELITFKIGSKLVRYLFKSATDEDYKINPYYKFLELNNNTVTFRSGRSYQFNLNDEIQSHTNSIGEIKYTYEYKDFNGTTLMSKKSNRFGRYIEFERDSPENKVSKITDQDGIEIRYEYNARGNLVKIKFPDSTPLDMADNPTKEYLYERLEFPDFITGIIDETGQLFANIEYDDVGKAVVSEHYNGVDRVEVSYKDEVINSQTIKVSIVRFFREASSNTYREEKYQSVFMRGVYRLIEKEIVKCDGCSLGSETWIYNSTQGTLSEHVSREGIRTRYVYNNDGLLMQKREAFGTAETLYTQYYYYPDNKLFVERNTKFNVYYTYDPDGNLTSTRKVEVN